MMDVGHTSNRHLTAMASLLAQASDNEAAARNNRITNVQNSPHTIDRREQGRALQRLSLAIQERHPLPVLQSQGAWSDLLLTATSLGDCLASNSGAITAAPFDRIDSHRHTTITDSSNQLSSHNRDYRHLPMIATLASTHGTINQVSHLSHVTDDASHPQPVARYRHVRSIPAAPDSTVSSTAGSAARPLRRTLDFNAATVRNSNQPGLVSANTGIFLRALGESWYAKPVSDRMLAAREVTAANIYSLFSRAPAYFLAENCPLPDSAPATSQLCVASSLENYQDFGDFMQDANSAATLARLFPDYPPENLQAFKENAEQIRSIDLHLQELRLQHPMAWWRSETNTPLPQLVAQYRPQAELLDALMTNQFALLPSTLRKEIQTHLVVSQLINDWDPLNAFYRNMGIVNEHQQLHVMRLDFESGLDVGFHGLPKNNSFDIAVNQRPAVFPLLRHRFEQEHAQFSETLPLLGEAMHNFPYADYAYSSTENAGWAAAIRMEVAYRCVLMQQRDVHPITQIMEQVLTDTPEKMRGFQSPSALLQTMHARLDSLIVQAGGIDQIQHWARTNTLRAAAIGRHLNAAIRRLYRG